MLLAFSLVFFSSLFLFVSASDIVCFFVAFVSASVIVFFCGSVVLVVLLLMMIRGGSGCSNSGSNACDMQ